MEAFHIKPDPSKSIGKIGSASIVCSSNARSHPRLTELYTFKLQVFTVFILDVSFPTKIIKSIATNYKQRLKECSFKGGKYLEWPTGKISHLG